MDSKWFSDVFFFFLLLSLFARLVNFMLGRAVRGEVLEEEGESNVNREPSEWQARFR